MCEPHYSGDGVSPVRKKPVWRLGGNINLHQTQIYLARKAAVISLSLLNLGSVFTKANTTLPKGRSPLAVSRGAVHLCAGPAAPSALERAAHFSVLQQH